MGSTEAEMTCLARATNQYSVVVNFGLDFDERPYENSNTPSAKMED